MQLDPSYNRYYVYSAVIGNGETLTYGACPVVWSPQIVLLGGEWRPGLTWADGNYHLFESGVLSQETSQFAEECMYTAINEAEETSGQIHLDDLDYTIRWCVLEEEQINVVMSL